MAITTFSTLWCYCFFSSFQRKTESDKEVEEKPRKPKKASPYGEWQEIRQESVDQEDEDPAAQKSSQAASKTTNPYGKWEEITEEEDP